MRAHQTVSKTGAHGRRAGASASDRYQPGVGTPLLVAVFMAASWALTAQGAVTFFVNPDGQLGTADPTRDLAFQAALTRSHTEFNFDGFGHAYIMEPSNLLVGTVTVRPNLLDAAGNNAADLGANGNRLIETYPLVPTIPGIIASPALLNRTFSGSGDVVGAAVEFTFSSPVEGFGAWVMDDITEASQFVLKVTEVGGAVSTSSPLESGNGTTLAIEGFIGAVSNVGITRVVIEQQTLGGSASAGDFFYLDHVQVGRRMPAEICNNGVDDNGDGLADCDDVDCSDSPVCPENCIDGVDNNGDGLIDCDDPQCQNNPVHPQCGETFCADGLDNDGDGQADCSDADCFGQAGCTVESLCGDGLDNDGDGLTDCADVDCTDSAACPETCTDGIDNDADGLVDCADPECTDAANCPEVCDDGVDNDADGLVDCIDPECSGSPGCDNLPTFFVHPDGGLTTADPTLDLAFQAALTLPFTEFDFSDRTAGYIMEPSDLLAGSVIVRPLLLNAAGTPAADLSLNGDRLIEMFPSINPDVPEIVEGGSGVAPDAPGTAMLNRNYAGNAADVVGAAIEFTFSNPVEGFGTWILDDILVPTRFVLKITEVGGRTYVSVPMDSGNGTNLAVEGFIGAVSQVGIIKAVVEQQTLNGVPTNADFFYLDHIQVGSKYPGCHDPFADFDGDGDVDMDDFGAFQACYTGPGVTVSEACTCADRNGDEQVDLEDFGAFQACASGPDVPAVKGCDDPAE